MAKIILIPSAGGDRECQFDGRLLMGAPKNVQSGSISRRLRPAGCDFAARHVAGFVDGGFGVGSSTWHHANPRRPRLNNGSFFSFP
jgi:hypothetical protein